MWTKTAPTEAGYYWWKCTATDTPEIVGLRSRCMEFVGEQEPEDAAKIGGFWWPTPIQQPTEKRDFEMTERTMILDPTLPDVKEFGEILIKRNSQGDLQIACNGWKFVEPMSCRESGIAAQKWAVKILQNSISNNEAFPGGVVICSVN